MVVVVVVVIPLNKVLGKQVASTRKPFSYWLTQVVLENRPLNECSSSSSSRRQLVNNYQLR